MTSLTVQTHRPVAVPRGAALAAHLMARLLKGLEFIGRARAAATVRRMEATRVAEAAELRRYAQTWVSHDHRFAAELMAAADRHEIAE